MFIIDDIGSFPVNERKKISEIARNFFNVSDEEKQKFYNYIKESFIQKIETGIDAITYPQLDMHYIFNFIENFSVDEPYIIDDKHAIIPEVEAIKIKKEEIGKFYYEKFGKNLNFRICITGPLEFYLKNFGFQVEGDLLMNISKSVNKILKNSIINDKYIKTTVISIDEPSLGFSDITVEDENLIRAWNESIKDLNCETQIHLHSSLVMDKVFNSNIKIIGIESSEDRKNLDFNKQEIEKAGKFLRIGISRSNIFGIMAENEQLTREKKFKEMVEISETPNVIEERLRYAYNKFGNLIKYVGPDCGLGAWPDFESAKVLLKNTVIAVRKFEEKLKN